MLRVLLILLTNAPLFSGGQTCIIARMVKDTLFVVADRSYLDVTPKYDSIGNFRPDSVYGEFNKIQSLNNYYFAMSGAMLPIIKPIVKQAFEKTSSLVELESILNKTLVPAIAGYFPASSPEDPSYKTYIANYPIQFFVFGIIEDKIFLYQATIPVTSNAIQAIKTNYVTSDMFLEGDSHWGVIGRRDKIDELKYDNDSWRDFFKTKGNINGMKYLVQIEHAAHKKEVSERVNVLQITMNETKFIE